jgi:hypothetical protein
MTERSNRSWGNQASYAWNVTVGLCRYTSRVVEEYVRQALAAAEGFRCWCLKGGERVSLDARLKRSTTSSPPKYRLRSDSTPNIGRAGRFGRETTLQSAEPRNGVHLQITFNSTSSLSQST